ncbi:MAG: signal peptidase I [Myxococcota bacterium]
MSDAQPETASKGDAGKEAAAGKEGAREPSPQRSPRQIKSAVAILKKEAKRILKKNRGRIAAEPTRAIEECLKEIEVHLESEDWRELQTQAERLDELLERHAGFARKSAIRETLENVGIAVLIALGLRSCLYEPFKIPSGSMMPTLRNGDHIFVNKFVYGIQIPFTNTVVGQSFGDIEAGDIIVFRFPLDEEQDFIKRVVGLPGDEVKVEGRQVSVKRAGTEEFVELPRKRLDDKCYDETGHKPVANCTLYEETMGDRTYVVRYRLRSEERGELAPPAKIWKVPEGHLMVMGDNRNDSLDSRRWEETVEAVEAEGLLSRKDLRDLTDERLFTSTPPPYIAQQADPKHDHVIHRAAHRAEDHDLALEAWREPTLGVEAVYDTKVATWPGGRALGWDALVGPSNGPETDRLLQHGESIDAVYVAEDETARHAVLRLREPDAVVAFACGKALCPDDASVAKRVGAALDRFGDDRSREARDLLVRPSDPSANYSSHFKSRHSPKDHYFERRFASTEPGPRGQVRLRVFRKPEEGTEQVRDAALRRFGIDPQAPDGPKPEVSDLGLASWIVDDGNAWVSIAADITREMVVVLECGKHVCNREAKARELAAQVHGRVPRAAGDRRRMRDLLGMADLDGLPEVPARRPELYEYDRVQLEATVKGDSHSVELEAWLHPEGGTSGKVDALREEMGGLEADDSVVPGAYGGSTDDAVVFVFPVAETEAVIRLKCHHGLCPSRETAVALARRAANRATDPSKFIEPDAIRPKPFVPRGNVKGRADRIWLPLSRFWLPVR